MSELNPLGTNRIGMLARLSSPESGGDCVEGSFTPFAGSAAVGTSEHAGDGLCDLGDYVTEPEMSR